MKVKKTLGSQFVVEKTKTHMGVSRYLQSRSQFFLAEHIKKFLYREVAYFIKNKFICFCRCSCCQNDTNLKKNDSNAVYGIISVLTSE